MSAKEIIDKYFDTGILIHNPPPIYKNLRIILSGPAASGKDYLRDYLIEHNHNFRPAISFTTRPPRTGEQNGVSYHFIPDYAFNHLRETGFFFESIQFNSWQYGYSRHSWQHDHLFIMTPSGIRQIPEEDRNDCLIIYLDIPVEARKKRLEQRSDADAVDRRLQADEKDFENFREFDLKITDPEFSAERLSKILH